jgi:GNAT superfamily N-acetyltransferase
VQIRDATRDDVPAIVALLAADQLGQHREDPTPPLDPAYWAAFDAIEGDPHNRLVVLVDDGEVVGTQQLTFIPYLTHRGSWRAQVEGVRVAAHRRGEGLGHELLAWAVARARERGCHLVQLTSNRARTEAHRFYGALGFEATHEGFKLTLS